MKMKEFGPPGGTRVPGAPPWIRQCKQLALMPIFSVFVKNANGLFKLFYELLRG